MLSQRRISGFRSGCQLFKERNEKERKGKESKGTKKKGTKSKGHCGAKLFLLAGSSSLSPRILWGRGTSWGGWGWPPSFFLCRCDFFCLDPFSFSLRRVWGRGGASKIHPETQKKKKGKKKKGTKKKGKEKKAMYCRISD